jgi:sulfide:quinone oxidoreductase
MTDTSDFTATRRGFLAMAVGGAAMAAAGPGPAQTVRSNARIVILGAGAGGAAMANRLAARIEGAQITVIDGRAQHWYQPGFTLIAAGLKPASYAISRTTEWLPRGITFLADYAAEIDPESQRVRTLGGQSVDYDHLIVATGLTLDWDAIEGFDLSLIGPEHGISAHYAGPEAAVASWHALDRFTDRGGVGLFGRPATEMKCAGAPVKIAFLAEDIADRKGNRSRCEFVYNAQAQNLFGVPVIHHRVRQIMDERGIAYRYQHVLKAIDPVRKIATYALPEGAETETGYDFINIVPPQRAPQVIRDSGLSHPERWLDQGWLHVDPATLRHMRYSNIWGLGDINGVPKGKTAASVKWHLPVIEDHLVAALQGREGTRRFNGYTSCPLITRIGRAMLVEFDYNDNLTPSFPGVIAPLEELWVSWLMKEVALKATYNAMLRGLA